MFVRSTASVARPTAPRAGRARATGRTSTPSGARAAEYGANTSGAHEFPAPIHILSTSFESPPDPLNRPGPYAVLVPTGLLS